MSEPARLTSDQVTDIAELTTRRYFDHYLLKVLPKQMETAIKIHDSDDKSHGGVEKRFNRMIYIVGGAFVAGSGGGLGLSQILPLIF